MYYWQGDRMPSSRSESTLQPIEESSAWQALKIHQQEVRLLQIKDLFASDPDRFKWLSLQAPGLLFDYSKHLITPETLKLLVALAEQAGISEAIAAMFAGKPINNTESRPALHVALRSPANSSPQEKAVHATLNKMTVFVDKVQNREWTGFDGQASKDIVNIGIGGSDLGPAMAYAGLSAFHTPGIHCHFISNVDPSHLQQTLAHLNPATTLFIIASKTFSTLETMQNARSAKRWLLTAAFSENELNRHFAAVTSNPEKAQAFGIEEQLIFPFWDWVGGRYSLWSAIGLPIALGTGMHNFRELLAGAHAMDEHFRTSPPNENMPLLMALLAIWYLNFFKTETQVILPYIQNLHLFPAFLQQLDMESLGKSVHKDGSPQSLDTGGLIWGSVGTNGQHSFHQLLHQGTHLVPADFIASVNSSTDNTGQHRHLLANCFAQSQALMLGKSLSEVKAELAEQDLDETGINRLAPHQVIAGNKPSSTILMRTLSPFTLGSLIAAYEHKVYAQSVILDINAFDQWGVELGKVLSSKLYQAINEDEPCTRFDASTNGLINYSKIIN